MFTVVIPQKENQKKVTTNNALIGKKSMTSVSEKFYNTIPGFFLSIARTTTWLPGTWWPS
jgi:hypothetical protein